MASTIRLDWKRADQDYKKGQQLIKQGDWANGLKLHELRALPDAFWNPTAKFPGVRTSFDKAPVWMPGYSIRSRPVIVWSEAGWGDIIQFSRFIPLLKQAGADKVILVYPEAVTTLMKRLKGIDVISDSKHCPPASYRIKTMSLPYLLMEHGLFPKQPVDKVFGSEGLYKNPAIIKPIRSKPLVGIFWHTNNKSWNMAAKQIPESFVKKFVDKHKDTCDFVSLQMEKTFLDPYLSSPAWHLTADKLQELDLVISVDSAIAHCAASVGVPTINMIGDESMACWRWYPKGESTYWYDTMKCVWWDDYQDWDAGFKKVSSLLGTPKKTKKKEVKK